MIRDMLFLLNILLLIAAPCLVACCLG